MDNLWALAESDLPACLRRMRMERVLCSEDELDDLVQAACILDEAFNQLVDFPEYQSEIRGISNRIWSKYALEKRRHDAQKNACEILMSQ